MQEKLINQIPCTNSFVENEERDSNFMMHKRQIQPQKCTM